MPKLLVLILRRTYPSSVPLTYWRKLKINRNIAIKRSGEPLYRLDFGDSLSFYDEWDRPTTIISDGAYGVGGFLGDPRTPNELVNWYKPHVEAWSRAVTLATTLWFWNTEIGWANVHPLLEANGWSYEFCNIWNKGVGQVAGNVNGKTIRRFPVVSEVCVYYTRTPLLPENPGSSNKIHMKKWLLNEWIRSGLPRNKANEAAGVKNAATRKYFDQGWLWYYPPTDVMMKLVEYANAHGAEEGKPYYSFDGVHPVTVAEWDQTRSIWNNEYGITNVWDRPSLRGQERYRGSLKKSAPRAHKPSRLSATHLNQKPLDLMERIIKASTNPGDVVWEPFGGLCSGSVAANQLGRNSFAAEVNREFYDLANERLESLQIRLL